MSARLWIWILIPLLSAPSAYAQGARSGHVTLDSLTIDDQEPPESYRVLFGEALAERVRPVEECYRQRLSQRPNLRGQMRLRVWISARQVIRTTVENSSLSDRELEECTRSRVREFRLPESAPEGGAMVRFTLRFETEAAASTPTASTAGVAPETGSWTIDLEGVRGGLTDLSMLTHRELFRECEPQVGDLQLRVAVSRHGVVSARRVGGTLRNGALVRCVLRALSAQRLERADRATRAMLILANHW